MPRSAPAALALMLLAAACSSGGDLTALCERRNELTRPPDPAAEATELVNRANQTRADKGLSALAVDTGLADKAQSWSAEMVRQGRLFHSRVDEGVTAKWERLGENVGSGAGPESIHQTFVGSPPHYANLINPEFTHIGIGVVADASGTRYVTEVFMRLATSTSTTAPASAPRAPARRPVRPSAMSTSTSTSTVTTKTAPTSTPPEPVPTPEPGTAPSPTGPPPQTPSASPAAEPVVALPEPIAAPPARSGCRP